MSSENGTVEAPTSAPTTAECPVRKIRAFAPSRDKDPNQPHEANHGMSLQNSIDLGGSVMVCSKELVDFAFRTPRFSGEDLIDQGNTLPQVPLAVDPPKHTKYRRFLDPLFNPRRIDALDADIRARCNEFIDAFIERGSCDFTEEFAEMFPSSVFLSLLDLPMSELATLQELRDGILRPGEADMTPEERAAIQDANGQNLYAYFGKLLDERTENPGEDLLSKIATGVVEGEPFTRDEMLGMCFLLVTAGLDTVTDALTCFWAFLATHPEHRQQIVDNPEVIDNAVEELLRYESPVAFLIRWAKEETLLGDNTVKAGHHVIINVGAGNLDPREFPEPLEVQFDRKVSRHTAFGGGPHRCLGSHLARRELRIALEEWHRRIPEYTLTPGYELGYTKPLRFVPDLQLSWES